MFVALLFRVAVFVVVSQGYHVSLQSYTNKGDGESYKRYAMMLLGHAQEMTDYDRRDQRRIAGKHAAAHLLTRLPIAASALAVTWISAGAAAALSAMLFADRRIGWAMVMLIPHYPINSSLAMSEAPMLALTVGGLWLAWRERSTAGGILLGLAGLVRPVAAFAVIALFIAEMRRGRGARGLIAAGVAGAVVLAGVAAMARFNGDAFAGVRVYLHSPRAYDGQMFTWPMHALLENSLRADVSIGRLAYIWIHVVVVITATAALAVRLALKRTPTIALDTLCCLWLASNTIFELCIASGRSGWGFSHFPRFMIPAMPALFWAVRPFLPDRKTIWGALACGMFAMAVFGVRSCP